VILIRPNGEKVVVDTGLRFSNGITMSPDQTLLYVADTRHPLGLQLPDPAGWNAEAQAEVLLAARLRLG
jgi:sugar lactone lactonase YvrE